VTPGAAGTGRAPGARWPASYIVGLIAALVAGIVIRVVLLPTEGLRGDLDQFVLWVHGIAVDGLPNAYDQNLSFPPVMAYVWGLLAAVQPAFQTVTDASDPAIRALMKTPASVADIGLALLVAYALRDRPRWAVIGAAAIALHPAVIDISAWWGQYESIYMVSTLAAVICAVNGRNGLAAALLAVALMTKPQVLPFLVPFAAWFWATGGWRGLLRAAAIGLVVIVALWLPFIPAGGPANYLKNLAEYQGEIFNILSLRAWNLWWLVQSLFAGGGFVADDVAFLGPLTLRHVGYVLTGLLSLLVAFAILRDPRPRTLILGLAAATLIAFCFLTSMHERYAYGALVFLMLLIPEARVRWLGIAFGVVFTLNLLAAVPPTPRIAELVPVDGWLGIAGSIAMLAIAATTVWLLRRGASGPEAQAA
jgi:Gpi18-like mannosyltransferase